MIFATRYSVDFDFRVDTPNVLVGPFPDIDSARKAVLADANSRFGERTDVVWCYGKEPSDPVAWGLTTEDGNESDFIEMEVGTESTPGKFDGCWLGWRIFDGASSTF